MDRLREIRIPLIVGSVAVMALLLFICDYTRRGDIGSREEIGSIIFRRRGVQRKFVDEVVWERIEQGTRLANSDSIRTDDKSEVKIRLKDGTVLTVDQNSMIQLDVASNRIRFETGSMQVQSSGSSSLTLQSGDSKVQMGEGSLTLSKSEKQDLSLTVYEGTARVTSGGKTENVGRNQKADIGKEGISVKEVPVVLIKPNPFQNVPAEGDGTSVSFKFQPSDSLKKPTLEISKDQEFKDSRKVQTPGVATMDLPPGTYYWRVTGEDAKTNQPAMSETRKMTIVRGEPLRLHSPGSGERVAFNSNPPPVPFAWSQDPLAESYELEVARDAGFTQIVKTIVTASNSVTIDDLPAGSYRWRIRTKPNQPDLNSRISQSGSFEVYKTDLVPPETASPFMSEHLTVSEAKEGIFFNWRAPGEMKSFVLQISQNPGFGNSLMNQQTEQNFSVVKGMPEGIFYWRVRGTTASGKETPYSAVQSFTIGDKYMKSEMETPDATRVHVLFPLRQAVDMTGRKSIDFKWEAVPGARKYNIRLYRNLGGKYEPIYAGSTTATGFSYTDMKSLDIGYFAWEVQAEGGTLQPSGRIDFSITLNRYLQNLKPGDIQFVNPENIYREEQNDSK